MGEAPGAAEDRVGLPFVGRAGRRLDEALIEAGIPAESTGMLNVLKCRPPANRFDARAAKVCRPYLDRQLAWLDPKLVVTLGSWALRTLDPSAPALLQTAGTLRTWLGRQLLPLIHPAATFHSRRFLDRWQLDLRTLRTEFARIADQTL